MIVPNAGVSGQVRKKLGIRRKAIDPGKKAGGIASSQ